MSELNQRDYSFAYKAIDYKKDTIGFNAIFANHTSKWTHLVGGQTVRLACEGNKEVTYQEDGSIRINHLFPNTDGMNIYNKIRNKLGKIVVGFLGECDITTFTPIPESALDSNEHVKILEQNNLVKNMHYRS